MLHHAADDRQGSVRDGIDVNLAGEFRVELVLEQIYDWICCSCSGNGVLLDWCTH